MSLENFKTQNFILRTGLLFTKSDFLNKAATTAAPMDSFIPGNMPLEPATEPPAPAKDGFRLQFGPVVYLANFRVIGIFVRPESVRLNKLNLLLQSFYDRKT